MPKEPLPVDESYGLKGFAAWLGGVNDAPLPDAPLDDSQRHVATSRREDAATVDLATAGSVDLVDPGPLPEAFGRYRVERLIDSGGFAAVFLARDDELDRPVAIKAPFAPKTPHPALAEAFIAEARRMALIRHPHVVAIYDFGVTPDGQAYVVSEFVEGASLEQRLSAVPWRWQDAVALAAKVADALHVLHRTGIVHRDVKPSNILIDAAGEPRLADFGLAISRDEISMAPAMAGTFAYMSPEQATSRAAAVDGRSDVWSLGVVLYRMLTGRLPFASANLDELLEQIRQLPAQPPRQTNEAVPEDVEQACLQALGKHPSQRYATAADFAKALRWCGGRTIPWRRIAVAVGATIILAAAATAMRPAAPLDVLSFEVRHYDRTTDLVVDKGTIGKTDAGPVHFADSVRLHATFNRPAYAAIYALDADGQMVRRWPAEDATDKPSKVFEYPPILSETGNLDVYTLNDAVGLQGFVLTVDDEPFDTRVRRDISGDAGWRKLPPRGLWVYDGRRFDFIRGAADRGDVETLATPPEPFRRACREIQRATGADAVRAIAFPVLPAAGGP